MTKIMNFQSVAVVCTLIIGMVLGAIIAVGPITWALSLKDYAPLVTSATALAIAVFGYFYTAERQQKEWGRRAKERILERLAREKDVITVLANGISALSNELIFWRSDLEDRKLSNSQAIALVQRHAPAAHIREAAMKEILEFSVEGGVILTTNETELTKALYRLERTLEATNLDQATILQSFDQVIARAEAYHHSLCQYLKALKASYELTDKQA